MMSKRLGVTIRWIAILTVFIQLWSLGFSITQDNSSYAQPLSMMQSYHCSDAVAAGDGCKTSLLCMVQHCAVTTALLPASIELSFVPDISLFFMHSPALMPAFLLPLERPPTV